MIEGGPPEHWRDLQDVVARILRESGLDAETDHPIDTVRGAVNIDVIARDKDATPESVYLCECKHWARAVPKNVVHGFRTVVADSGANVGIVISSAGFQSGAVEAAAHSNLRLLGWDDFQELFADRWFQRYMAPTLREEVDPLVEYTEPINSRIFGKADALPPNGRERFKVLRQKHFLLALGLMPMWLPVPPAADRPTPPRLPLRTAAGPAQGDALGHLPDDVLDAVALRPLMDALLQHYHHAIAEFDEVFGERA